MHRGSFAGKKCPPPPKKKIHFMSVKLKCCTCNRCHQQNRRVKQRAGIQFRKPEKKKCSHPSQCGAEVLVISAQIVLQSDWLNAASIRFNYCMIGFIIMLAAPSAVRFFRFLSVRSAFCCLFSFCYTCCIRLCCASNT